MQLNRPDFVWLGMGAAIVAHGCAMAPRGVVEVFVGTAKKPSIGGHF
jgi:hypothetical protein